MLLSWEATLTPKLSDKTHAFKKLSSGKDTIVYSYCHFAIAAHNYLPHQYEQEANMFDRVAVPFVVLSTI